MKKITFLFALLCASVMGWAGVAQDTWIPTTAPSTEVYAEQFKWFAISGENYEGVSVNQIEDHAGVIVIYVNFPDAVFDAVVGCERLDDAGALAFLKVSSLLTQENTDIYIKNGETVRWAFRIQNTKYSSGGSSTTFDPASVDWTSSDNTTTYHKVNDQFQIAAENAANMPTGPLNIQQPAWAAFEGIYIEVPAGVSACAFDDVAVTDGTEYDGNTGAGIVLNPSALTNEITKVTVTHGLGTTTFYVHNANAGASQAPGESPYCDTEVKHQNLDNAAANSHILLSVGSDGQGHTIVNLKPTATNAVTFDYINVVGKKEVGSDIASGGAEEMAIMFRTPAPDANGDITFTVQWSYPNWSGRYEVAVTVPADATCASADPFPGDNTYCSYTDNQLRANNANVALTWGTDGSGNVIVDITDGEGATNSAFRNGGFENEGSFAATWWVYSGTNHATCEPATTYFNNGGTLSNGNKRFTLTKKADLPANAVIAFFGHAFSWRTDQATGAYHENKYFGYQYGYNCPLLSAPTNVAVNGSKVITFDAVANAETYTAKVYLDGILKHSQVVANGDVLSFIPYTTGTYQVQVVADAAGYPTSDPSEAYDWALTAPAIVLGNSEYCEHTIGSGTSEAQITWETSVDGSITITIQEVLGGAADATHFRGTGMNINNFQVGEARTSASAYFNHACGGSNQVTLTLKNASIKPGLGEKIYYTDKVVEWATSGNNNAYSNLTFEYTYGTICSGQKHVTVSVNNNEWGSATVNGGASADVDAGTTVTCVATPATGYEFVNWTKNGVEVATTATYTPTIDAATDLVANFDYERTTYCFTPVLTNQGKKVYLTVGKGTTEGTYQIKIYGSAELPITGIYNANTAMNFIKFNELDGNDIYLTVANGGWSYSATGNGVISSAEIRPRTGYTWRDIWNWGGTLEFNEGVLHNINSTLQQRYYFNWNSDCVDAEKPVMTSASLVSNTASTAVLNVAATDDHVVDAYHVVDGTNGIDETFPAAAQITLTGLAGGTTYNFEVTAIDATGKESDTPADVQVIMAAAASPVPTEAAPVPTWPADQVMSIYSAYDFAPASLNSYNEVWYLPPTMAEENVGGDNYLRYHTNMSGVVGWQFGQISVALMEYIHVDIWPSVDGTITMGPTSADPTQVASVTLNVVAGQWNSFNISIAELQAVNASFDVTKVFQNQFTGYSAQTTFSVDNVYFYRTTPPPADLAAPTDVTVNSAVASFTSVTIKAQANDDSGVVHFKVLNGSDVLVADVEAVSGAEAILNVTGLSHSTAYTLSLIAFDAAGHEAAPVAVPVTTLAVPAAAPQPTHDELAVLSVYSNEYTPAVAASFNKSNWGSAPVAYEADYLLYNMSSNVIVWGNNDGNAGHGNIDGLSGKTHETTPGLDVSEMKYIHFDVWCDKANQLNTVNINDVAVPIPTTRTVAGEWVSFDVDITGVALADKQNVRWLKFHPFSTTECHAAIDNVYFYKEPDYTRDDSWMAPGELGTVCYPQGLLLAGATMYKMAGTDANGKFVFDEVTELEPGVPYLFEATADVIHFYATEATPAAEAGESNGMKGTFSEITIPQNSPNIYYFSGQKFYAVTARQTALTVPANRAYVDLTEPHPAMAPKPGIRRITFDVQGANTTTGVDNFDASETPVKVMIDGQLYILRGEKMYNANGQIVK